jgi:hypothetical protein
MPTMLKQSLCARWCLQSVFADLNRICHCRDDEEAKPWGRAPHHGDILKGPDLGRQRDVLWSYDWKRL